MNDKFFKLSKLNILLMTPWMEYFLGSETHTYTIAKELLRLGHKVSVFTYLKKSMWEMMKTLDVEILEDNIEDKYDLAIINGNNCLVRAPKSAYKIFISNGTNPSVEYPLENADKVVAISEEVRSNLSQYGYNAIVIRNGIDCNRFKSVNKINKKLKNVLLLNNQTTQADEDFKMLNNVCNKLNLTLFPIGLNFGTTQWETERLINECDLVISMGRGTYEAMACERNAIVMGYGKMVGFVNNKTYPEFMQYNCAGREVHPFVTEENLIEEFKKYNPDQGIKNRKLILEHNNIEKTVQKFLDIYHYRNLNI